MLLRDKISGTIHPQSSKRQLIGTIMPNNYTGQLIRIHMFGVELNVVGMTSN